MIKMLKLIFLLTASAINLYGQNFLSNLSVTEDDPVYTTYNAAMSRSEYIVNEGYQFVWFDQQKGMNFETRQAGNIGLIFSRDNITRDKLQQYYQKPLITASYSDLLTFYYYPYKHVKVEEYFLVYSSRIAVRQIRITNESDFDLSLNVYPFIQNERKSYTHINLTADSMGIEFQHNEFPDGWMKEHNIPFQSDLENVFLLNTKPGNWGTYDIYEKGRDTSVIIFINAVKKNNLNRNLPAVDSKIIVLSRELNIPAGKTAELRVVRGVIEAGKDISGLQQECKKLLNDDLNNYVREDETIYEKIPSLNFSSKDKKLLYYNAFSLIRQCMLPPEGECSYNYYVFSREPRWGWGYGGQVFHESLTMLAYAYMDPESAMNSQRVFMERQHPDGYINYRTGPYLNESIPENGQLTSSAPWFNWQNWEIYRVTKDKDFL